MSLSIIGMKPGDVYEDRLGNRFVVVGYWAEPVIIMEQGESLDHIQSIGEPRSRMTGGITGLMWDGFKLVQKATQDEGETR